MTRATRLLLFLLGAPLAAQQPRATAILPGFRSPIWMDTTGQVRTFAGPRDRVFAAVDSTLQSLGIPLDVRDREGVQGAVDGLPERFRGIDVLINNAGLALGLEPAQRVDLEDWETMVDTNIKGLMYCSRFVLPGMVARKRGHIVNISSTAGDWPYPGGNVYGGTKAFVGLTTSIFSRPYMRVERDHGKMTPPRMRLYHSMYQLFSFTMLLALTTKIV